MNAKLRDPLTIINAFVHDVATGTWVASLVFITVLHRETSTPAWTSLVVILVTGVVRMLTYKVFGWTGDVSRDRVRLLKIKHAVLGTVFLAGTLWMAALVYA